MSFKPEWISLCIRCTKQLTVSSVPFSGKVSCPGCGAVNIFRNSQYPCDVLGEALTEIQSAA
jgi:predicted RNA-binding Zn-ribbon protein involved in translation (DUF1610 family)